MKTAEECKDLNEIRQCIDTIDSTIISQLALRSSFVAHASRFKKSISEVQAPDRVKAMLETRRQWAQDTGINPDFIQHLFEQIVSYFIKGETIDWAKQNTSL